MLCLVSHTCALFSETFAVLRGKVPRSVVFENIFTPSMALSVMHNLLYLRSKYPQAAHFPCTPLSHRLSGIVIAVIRCSQRKLGQTAAWPTCRDAMPVVYISRSVRRETVSSIPTSKVSTPGVPYRRLRTNKIEDRLQYRKPRCRRYQLWLRQHR